MLRTSLVLLVFTLAHLLSISLGWQVSSPIMIPSTFGRMSCLRKRIPRASRAIGCRMLAKATSAIDLEEHRSFVEKMLSLTGDPLEQDGGRIVVYRGNPQARLMLIGEAPGADEDKLGAPFVGRSGQLLDDILKAVGVDPEHDIYVSNIVRRRPAKNRTPTADELAYYVPMLLEEIRLVDPDIIVTLGASSTTALLPHETRGITKIRGQWVSNEDLMRSNDGVLNGRRVMPWFHPSYLLRNAGERSRQEGGVRWLTREDLREVKRALDAVSQP